MTHTFAICAYQESAYLEDCILSLKKQRIPSTIILCTSTPNEYIQLLSDRYDIPMHVNAERKGIGEDWNYAFAQAKTDLVTIAHQDDVYESNYSAEMLRAITNSKNPLICFSDYYEIRDGKNIYSRQSRMLRLKEIMLLPLRLKRLQSTEWARRAVISFGNPICCPAVTYVKSNLQDKLFSLRFKSNLDWNSWEQLSRKEGSFIYVPRPLMGHRIHDASTTTQIIGTDHGRTSEDLQMFLRFWPAPVAKSLAKLYSKSQDSNAVV